MARARGIKPGVFNDPDVVELPFEGRWLFVGLWTLADRAGRLEDKPRHIKMNIFPCDDVDVDVLLQQIAAVGLIVRYKIDGVNYIQITGFVKHQSPHRDEKASTIPAPAHLVLPAAAKQSTRKPDAATPEHHASTVQTPCEHPASTMPCTLTADCGLLTADCLNGGGTRARDPKPPAPPPQFLPEYREVIKSVRPELDAETVFANFCNHFPPDKRTVPRWKKWVCSEFLPPSDPAHPPSTADPDSRASVEALALSLGLGKWDELAEQWTSYKSKVRGVTL